jgi:exopolyphosphatase/guanosine-5'-triphosphate,3'-diphosphate pyrophosphatase
MGAIMRVVYLLSASMPGVIPKLQWVRRGDRALTLLIPKSHAGLIGERPEGRIAQLSKVSGLDLRLAVAD